MKKFSVFLIPLLIFGVVFFLGTRVSASGNVHPALLLALAAGALLLIVGIRPKNKDSNASASDRLSILGDLAQEAFADDENLSGKFQSAVADYLNSRPKASIKKLTDLEAQCKTDADTYAVSVVLGLAKATLGEFDAAVKLYNRAVVLYPTAELAAAIGACQQRIGELKQAMDSYAFALELDPDHTDARSSLAIAYVADGDFEMAIEHANLVLDRDGKHASALATIAICYGVLGDPVMRKRYTEKAVANGYNEEKISNTIDTLKKRFKR